MDLFTNAKSSISGVASVTSTNERSVSVVANGVVVTVVKEKRTFIDIWKYLIKFRNNFLGYHSFIS